MKNKFGYFGLLGLLGILGIITDHRGFLGFFAYLSYFKYFTVIPDELFKDNIRKAATPAFFVSITTMSITIAISLISENNMILSRGLAICFTVSLLVFSVFLTIYEYKENRSKITYDN